MEVNCLVCHQSVDCGDNSTENPIIMNMNRDGWNSSGCLGNHGSCVMEAVDCLRSSSDSLHNSWGSVVEGMNSCWRGSDSLNDSWSSCMVNCLDNSWSCVVKSMDSCRGGPQGLDNSWLMVVNSMNGARANLMETAEECRVGSESSSEPGAKISLVETVLKGDRGGVVEGVDNSGFTVMKRVVQCADTWRVTEQHRGGGRVSDHSSSHDLCGCSHGRRGEHRQGRHQEAGLSWAEVV